MAINNGVDLAPNLTQVKDTNGNTILSFQPAASAVNYLQVNNAAALDQSISLSAVGSNTNLNIAFISKGTTGGFVLLSEAIQPIVWFSGTANQHITTWNIPNTFNQCDITLQDSSGTLAYLSDIGININVQTFTASGVYTPTSGMKFCIIETMGAGGGGGGVPVASASGIIIASGGGAGGYSRKTVNAATIGASQIVTIGTGGTGGSAGNNPGVDGGITSVGTLCISNGGSGAPGGLVGAQGGIGAVPGTGDIAAPGMCGLPSINTNLNTTSFAAGGGASTQWGQGGLATEGNLPGINGTGYGAGGSGAASSNGGGAQPGGDGSNGFVIITEYI